MDPFTQRMLERARARQEKIDQKLASSGQVVPKRKPLTENISVIKNQASPIKSPVKPSRESLSSPIKSKEPINYNTPVIKKVIQKTDLASPQRPKNDIIVTKKEFKSPKNSITRRNSDVSVEINISHRNDIQIEVQVEERDAPPVAVAPVVAGPVAVAAPIGAPNYRGPLSLAPGQPANILAADGRPLDTLDVNVDRVNHYTAKVLNSLSGHVLKKRSIVGAPIVAAPVAWSHAASIRIPARVVAPVAVAPLGLGYHW